MNRRTEILSICPDLREGDGRYLAVSPPDAVLRIGVVGSNADDARQRFQAELAEWATLSELPARSPISA